MLQLVRGEFQACTGLLETTSSFITRLGLMESQILDAVDLANRLTREMPIRQLTWCGFRQSTGKTCRVGDDETGIGVEIVQPPARQMM
jgi:hypothetical protein